ncbi:MAG: hypothetical protein ACRD4O_00670 [Bryobacteraceae bacterium]
MREHVKIVAILNIALGALGALAGLVILVIAGSIAGVIGRWANPQDAIAIIPILTGIGIAIAIFLFVLSLPSIVGGWGLLQFRPWARILMIVISALNLLHVPIGTAIGVYGLWVLLSNEGRLLFETGGRYPLPAPGPQAVYSARAAYPAQTTYPHQPPPGV